jgi:tetratricopeptide (TPR) repeat protein
MILNAYAERGRYDRVLAVWQEKLRQKPDTPDDMLSLAATYYKLGRTPEAIATINRVIELAPTFKERGEYYIKQMKAGKDIEGK